jgi:hypothetical protein
MKPLSRRDFLKLSGVSLAAFAASTGASPYRNPELKRAWSEGVSPLGIGRVAVDMVYLHAEPSSKSERTGRRYRDQLLTLYDEVTSQDGPPHNPRWYLVDGGFTHSGRVQRIERRRRQPFVESIPEEGLLCEVIVPFTRAYRRMRFGSWQRLYRLHFGSLHWIESLEEGPDGRPWYRLIDHRVSAHYSIPAASVRPVFPDEYTPISQDIPPEEKRIEVSIANQRLTAFEGERAVFHASASTGRPSPRNLPEDLLPTETPQGSFRIQNKMPSRHMGDGNLTDDIYAYELPGVPWTMVFHESGAATHGTYWHDNFGTRMSAGCVNLRNEDALWLFRWSTPVFDTSSWYKMEAGTRIRVY